MSDIDYLKKYLPSEKLEEGIEKLKRGEPVQYIVGNTDFYGNFIKVNKSVLIPRFETEELVEKTISYINQMFKGKVKIADLGTGSGCIAITLKKEIDCDVDAVDISSDALKVAKENALNNNVEINFYVGDMLNPLSDKYDVIISNPPYISYDMEIMDNVKKNEPHIALYANNNGLYYYEEILKNINRYLKSPFFVAFEIGYEQGNDIILLVNKYLPKSKVVIEKDMQGKDRFAFITQ